MTEQKIQVQSLYFKAPKIHTKNIDGKYARLRDIAAWLLLGWYYGSPWLTWNDRQAILFDLPGRKFHLFGLTLWPQDFVFLTGLLILAALSLFFFTALAGRLWCGYACPQTVWTKVFIWMERITEGDRNARIRLQKEAMSARKFRIKFTKHTMWLVFSAFTGYTFVGFFIPIRELSGDIIAGTLGGWAWFWIVFYSFATWGNAGKLREQVCIYMCPYARFQSAMFDKDTLIISYDKKRGEPRGKRKHGEKPEGLGDCIDCLQCVHVCPTGIDIRNGLQMECIACAACIDACDEIMDQMKYPRGLVHYSTERKDSGGKMRIFRPRILIYGALLLVLFVLYLLALSMRIPMAVDVIRDRGRLYNVTALGTIENVYQLRVMNKDQQNRRYTLDVKTPAEAKITMSSSFTIKAGEILIVPVRVEIDPYLLQATTSKVFFTIQDQDVADYRIEEDSSFIKPAGAR